MATTIYARMKQLRDTSANWTAINPVLLEGEIGVETNTGRIKIGDGSTAWNSIVYINSVNPIYEGPSSSNIITLSLDDIRERLIFCVLQNGNEVRTTTIACIGSPDQWISQDVVIQNGTGETTAVGTGDRFLRVGFLLF